MLVYLSGGRHAESLAQPSRKAEMSASGNKVSSAPMRRLDAAVSREKRMAMGFVDQICQIKIGTRPIALTRPSNDDITNLVRLDPPDPVPLVKNSDYKPDIDVVTHEIPLMTSAFPPKNKWRIISVCMWALACGMTDAAPGALLPTMEKAYGINYTVVSLMWMLKAAGFILVAIFSHRIPVLFGKRKAISFGCLCSIIMLSIVSSGVPFPVVVASFFLSGIGLAVVLAQVNVFLSRLDKSSKYLSFFHGSYGIGATASPLYATAMVNRGVKWNYTYLIVLGLMVINLFDTWFAFAGADEDLSQWDQDDEAKSHIRHNYTENEEGVGLHDWGAHLTSVMESEHVSIAEKKSIMKLALNNRVTWLTSIFVLLYQGSEVALGGWIVSYLLDYRNVLNSYGYVLSGFWGGLTLGRLLLTRPLHKAFGARKTIIVLALLSILFVVLIWVVPSSLAVGVFVGLAGVTIGPTYPLMITVVSATLPRRIQVVSLTIMTAFGSSGGAFFPFLVGLASQLVGTFVVLPIFVACYSIVLATWLMLPNIEQKLVPPNASSLLKFWRRVW